MKPVRLSFAQKLCRRLPPIIAQRLRDWVYPIERAYRDDYKFTVRSQTGSMFTSRTSDYHAYPFSVHGYFEWRNWAIAMACCSPGDTILEIGANIGTETVGFSDIVGVSGKVYAFEPLPSNLELLEETLGLNQYQNVVVFPVAVGEECKRVRFVVPRAKSASGIGYILGTEKQTNSNGIETDCVTLDSYSDRIGRVKVIFIDAEGAEVMILFGARKFIQKHKPTIVLEAHPKLLARAGFTLKGLYAEIRELEYKPFKISRLGLSRIELECSQNYHNWLCIPYSKLETAKLAKKYIRRCALLPCIPGWNPLTQRSYEGNSLKGQEPC
jgi:FkbM family methyltransferase